MGNVAICPFGFLRHFGIPILWPCGIFLVFFPVSGTDVMIF
jgi:hypothetical protein